MRSFYTRAAHLGKSCALKGKSRPQKGKSSPKGGRWSRWEGILVEAGIFLVNTDILLQSIIKKGQNEPNEGKMLHNKRAKTDSICTT